MARPKQLPPTPRARSREELFNAETSATSTSGGDERRSKKRRLSGEKVESPNPELLASSPPPEWNWSKLGFWVAVAIAAVTAIYNYAELSALARSTAEDVKGLKTRSEELLRSSVEANARIGALERNEAPRSSPAASAPTLPQGR